MRLSDEAVLESRAALPAGFKPHTCLSGPVVKALRDSVNLKHVTICAALCAPAMAMAQSDEACADFVCIQSLQTESGVTFQAVNRSALIPVTLVLRLETDNMRITRGSDDPVVLAGNSSQFLLELSPVTNGAWSWSYEFDWHRGDYRAEPDHSVIYRLPFEERREVEVTQSCNGSFSHFRASFFAVDFGLLTGDPVHAARAGRVIDVQEDSNQGGVGEEFRELANDIVILHADGTVAAYSHLQFGGAAVKIGDWVETGQLIGFAGNTGYSSGDHLDFVVRRATLDGSVSIPVTFDTVAGPSICPLEGAFLRVP